jgi:hypothetical protein
MSMKDKSILQVKEVRYLRSVVYMISRISLDVSYVLQILIILYGRSFHRSLNNRPYESWNTGRPVSDGNVCPNEVTFGQM